MRGNIEHSPQDIALAYMNNLAYLAGTVSIWDFGYYRTCCLWQAEPGGRLQS